jgi:hypothetical protein
MLIPGAADHPREGYEGQLTSDLRDSARPDNLFSPPSGDPGARGRFDNQAHTAVTGFDPVRLRAGGLLFVLTSIAGAFVAGAFVLGRIANARAAVRR